MPSCSTATTSNRERLEPALCRDRRRVAPRRQFGAGQEADLYVDQNLGATAGPGPRSATQLVGLDYVLFRDQVLECRRCPVARLRGLAAPRPRGLRRDGSVCRGARSRAHARRDGGAVARRRRGGRAERWPSGCVPSNRRGPARRGRSARRGPRGSCRLVRPVRHGGRLVGLDPSAWGSRPDKPAAVTARSVTARAGEVLDGRDNCDCPAPGSRARRRRAPGPRVGTRRHARGTGATKDRRGGEPGVERLGGARVTQDLVAKGPPTAPGPPPFWSIAASCSGTERPVGDGENDHTGGARRAALRIEVRVEHHGIEHEHQTGPRASPGLNVVESALADLFLDPDRAADVTDELAAPRRRGPGSGSRDRRASAPPSQQRHEDAVGRCTIAPGVRRAAPREKATHDL